MQEKYTSLIITPYFPRGGVGKTTTIAHLGYALSKYDKTIVIDSCPLDRGEGQRII